MKTLLKILLVLIVTIVLLVFVGAQFAPTVATNVVQSQTGFDVDINDKKISLLAGLVNFKDLVIKNSDAFPVADFLNINEVGFNADFKTLLSKQFVVEEVILDLDRLAWVKNKDDAVNIFTFIDALKAMLPESSVSSDEKPVDAEEPADAGSARGFLIKQLVVRLGSVSKMDYSGSSPHIKDFSVNYDRTFTDITSVAQLVGPLTADLTSLGMQFLADSLLQSLLSGPELLKDLGTGVLKGVEKPVEAVEEALDGVLDIFNKK